MVPRPVSDEMWGHQVMPSSCNFDIMMPNGLMLSSKYGRNMTLDRVKSEVWKQATGVAFEKLHKPTSYVFMSVTIDGKQEVFYDENRRLCDLRLFMPILKLVAPQGKAEEMIIQSEISIAIGKSVSDFDSSRDPELIDSRRNLLCAARDCVRERQQFSLQQKLLYFFPCDLDAFHDRCHPDPDAQLPIILFLHEIPGRESSAPLQLKIRVDETPENLIQQVARQQDLPNERLVLKVCGFDEYLLGGRKLYEYKYISQLMSQHRKAELFLKREADLISAIPDQDFLSNAFIMRYLEMGPVDGLVKERTRQNIEQQRATSLWQTNSNFRVQVTMSTYASIKEFDVVFVNAGLFHGTESLCAPKQTSVVESSSPVWHEILDFPILYEDLPRSARLCLCMCTVTLKKTSIPLSYCNIPIFDYEGNLKSGNQNLNFRRVPKEHSSLLHPMGVTGSGPGKGFMGLLIELQKFNTPVVFPPDCLINHYVQHLNDLAQKSGDSNIAALGRRGRRSATDADRRRVEEIAKLDPLAELLEDDKDLLWSLRNYCQTCFPDLLPKLLESVRWNSREEVAQLYYLLQTWNWKSVKVETALELLDCKFTDPKVRFFAVRCLDQSLPDHMLKRYLLQMVQVLLHQPYLWSEMGKFLLRRSLINRDIGHFFFWLLKAETHDPLKEKVCTLYLEAYCRGIGRALLKSAVKQIEAMDKLVRTTDLLKEKKDAAARERISLLRKTFEESDYREALSCLQNPLKVSASLGELSIGSCRIMDSAKRPLWLVWKNGDATADKLQNKTHTTHEIIFKNGDDLRQDMLTLQVITVIDAIWRSEGLDLKMLPYTCLATGNQVGLIEVVREARTVMSVQRSLGLRAALQVGSRELHRYFENKSKDSDRSYQQIMDTFTKSCAGYCVATFVLGIGDRNPDNIMVNDDGHIFHIDFGHFLGHFKKKFGINRERVPFVLTDDFLFVISRGGEISDSNPMFKEFIDLCERAYRILRKHAHLLITLFTLMLSTGIPELQTPDDIEYLRTTLQVDKSDEEAAVSYFRNQLNEAKIGSTYTKIDWFFHNVRR